MQHDQALPGSPGIGPGVILPVDHPLFQLCHGSIEQVRPLLDGYSPLERAQQQHRAHLARPAAVGGCATSARLGGHQHVQVAFHCALASASSD